MPCPARSPVRSRIVVPEFPQSRAILGSRKLPPCIVISFPFLLISIPQFLRQEIVEETSLPVERFINLDFLLEIDASIKALCDIDLSPGRTNVPTIPITF